MEQQNGGVEICLVDEKHIHQFSLLYTEAFRGKLKAFTSWSDDDLAELLADTGLFKNSSAVGNYMAIENGQVVGCLVLHFLPNGPAKIPGGIKQFFRLCSKYSFKSITSLFL